MVCSMKIRMYSHVGMKTGYGRASEGMAHSMLAAGIDLELRPLAPYDKLSFDGANVPLARLVRQDHELAKNPDVLLIHTLPLDCKRVISILENDEYGYGTVDARQIALTTWEGASRVPHDILVALLGFDEVWLPSTQNLMHFRGVHPGDELFRLPGSVDTKLRAIPHAFDESAPRRATKRALLDDRFRFYYLGAWTGRKNPAGLISAFIREFTPNDNVELVLRCAGGRDADFVIATHAAGVKPAEMAPIRFTGATATDEQIAELHRDADCFVSATRGEAWNLPAFEAMLAGRHVIHTGGTGADTFLADTMADLVDARRVPASVDVTMHEAPAGSPAGAVNIRFTGAQGLNVRGDWLEPDLYQLARWMRHAYDDRIRDISMMYDPAERFGYQAVGQLIKKALEAP